MEEWESKVKSKSLSRLRDKVLHQFAIHVDHEQMTATVSVVLQSTFRLSDLNNDPLGIARESIRAANDKFFQFNIDAEEVVSRLSREFVEDSKAEM